jgi:hypothetical protein
MAEAGRLAPVVGGHDCAVVREMIEILLDPIVLFCSVVLLACLVILAMAVYR